MIVMDLEPGEQEWTGRSRALADVEVVELSGGVAGAYCGLLLAQLGARVTRFGDATSVVAEAEVRQTVADVLHRGKLKGMPGQRDSLLSQAQIIIADEEALASMERALATRLMDRRDGLREDAVLVVLSSNGADQLGTGSALTSAAASGLSFAIGGQDQEPLVPPSDLVQYETAVSGAAAALIGLLSGGGRLGTIDVCSRDVLANLVGTIAQNYVPFGRPWRREGTRPSMSGGVYPCGLFACSDGYVAIYCRSTAEWRALVRAMGEPGWSREERFQDPKRVAMHHADEADSYLLPWTARFTRAELMRLGVESGFPVAPVRYVSEIFDDRQFRHRRSFESAGDTSGLSPSALVPAAAWRFWRGKQPPPAQAKSTRVPALGSKPATDPASLLRGLRVLDLTWVWSGPMVTSILADFGAEVIKIEHPSKPDSVRLRGRPVQPVLRPEGPEVELNPWFNQLNHGKKSVLGDLKSDDDRKMLLGLAESCDVVVENMRPGALEEAGLGYQQLAQVNPALVMLSMSMAGQAGPLSRMKGYAGIMTAMAGLESITGYPSSERNAPFVGMTMTAFGDPNGALHALVALLAALHERQRSNRGTWIDLAQTDAILSVLAGPIVESQLMGFVPVRGNTHPSLFPHGSYRCRNDGWVAVSVHSSAQWAALAKMSGVGMAGLAELGAEQRLLRRTEIEAHLRRWFAALERDAAVQALQAAGIPCQPVASYEEMKASDWLRQRGLVKEVRHPYIGPQDVFVPPWLFGGRTAGNLKPAPLLGEHSMEY